MNKIYIPIIIVIIAFGCGTNKVELPADESNPAISISSPADSAVIQDNKVDVTGKVSDAGSGVKTVTVSGGGKSANAAVDANGNFSAPLIDLGDGSINIVAQASDEQGNMNSASVKVMIDTAAPTVTLSPLSQYIKGIITFSASASDKNGITQVEFLRGTTVIGTDATAPYSLNFDTATVSDGNYSFTARATDGAGKQATSSTVPSTVDNSLPTISINPSICGDNVCNATEAPGGIVATAITVTTNAENDQIVTLFSNGNPIGTGTVASGSATITQGTALTEGSNNLVAGVADLAGNSSTSASVNVTLDTTLNIAIVYPSNNQWMNDTWDYDTGTAGLQLDVTVTTDAENGQTVTLSGGDAPVGGAVSNGSAIIRITFTPEGTKTLSASVTDLAGNPATSSTITVYYDKTAPTVTISSPAQNQLFKSTCPGGQGPLCWEDNFPNTPLFQTAVQVSATDNMATQAQMAGNTVNIYSNGNLVGSGPLVAAGPTTISVSLRDGGNALTATLSDVASNTGTASVVKTYTFVGQPGTITGWVYEPCTWNPISGATVDLSLDPQYNTILAKATTDVSGQFTLQNVPPGEYTNIRACLDRDSNGKCEILNGFGPDGMPGFAGVDDDAINGTDDCGEYEWAGSDDTAKDFVGFQPVVWGNGPIQVMPNASVWLNYVIQTWVGNSPWGGTCTISGTINDSDTSWAGVNTIIASLDFMGFGDESPVNVRSFTSVSGSTTPQAFTIYEQQFAPSDGGSFIGRQFLLAAGKDLNGNGRLDLNSEPFTTLSSASCGTAGLNFTLQPRVNIQGTVSGYTPGWVVMAGTDFGGGGGGAMSGSAADINPDGTYSLTVLGNSTYIVAASRDRDGFYLDSSNELSAIASIFPVTVGTGTIGGVNIAIPGIRTISGTASGAGISNWAVNAGTYNNSMQGWIEPTSNYYLLEVLPNQYWLNVFNDRNANLDNDPREGWQDYGSQVDVGTSSASGINIAVIPDIQLRNVFINDPAPADADLLAEPGETVGINVRFRNYRANATNVAATLSCVFNCGGSGDITINSPNPINYANINFDILTAPSAYSVSIGGGVSPGTKVTFGINLTADGGYSNYQEFSIRISEGHRNGTPPGLPASGAGVATGTSPNDVAIAVLSPANQKAYVANYGSSNVTVINALTNALITTIGPPNITGCPSTVAVSLDGTRAYVGNDCNGNVAVIDTNSNTVIDTINVGSNAYGVAVSPDGNELWVTHSWEYEVSIIDTSSGAVVETILLAGYPREITFSPDGEQVFVVNNSRIVVIDARDRRIQTVIPNVWTPWDAEIAIDPYSLYLYAFDWGGYMYRADIDTLSYTNYDFTASGINNSGSLTLTPDGALLYFGESGGTDNNVYVIDLNPLTGPSVIGGFASGTPANWNYSIAFTRAGNKCWVTNYSDNTATPAQ
ncbi:MAG TPA: Ig-like domain-containing protein [bacterium]